VSPLTSSQALREHYIELATRFAENPGMGLDAMREMFDTLSRVLMACGWLVR
jgi:hypothetical protein